MAFRAEPFTPEDLERIEKATNEEIAKALTFERSEIDAAARRVITDAGYGEYFSHGFGHSLGVDIHEAPNASSIETAVMPVGAVISAEPGIYIPGKLGVRIEDVLILSENGCEDITHSPKQLIVL